MRDLILLVFVTAVLASCTAPADEPCPAGSLAGFEDWAKDSTGCLRIRWNIVEAAGYRFPSLIGLSRRCILDRLGKPDHDHTRKDETSYLSYYYTCTRIPGVKAVLDSAGNIVSVERSGELEDASKEAAQFIVELDAEGIVQDVNCAMP
ncbi:MAG: hypothetical protein ABI432_15470 [Flavobacteriales bacterium]